MLRSLDFPLGFNLFASASLPAGPSALMQGYLLLSVLIDFLLLWFEHEVTLQRRPILKDLVSAHKATNKRLDQGYPNLMLSSWMTVLWGIGPQVQQSGPRGYDWKGLLLLSASLPTSPQFSGWHGQAALLCWAFILMLCHTEVLIPSASPLILCHSDGKLRQVPFLGLGSTFSVCFPRHCSSHCFFPLLWYIALLYSFLSVPLSSHL